MERLLGDLRPLRINPESFLFTILLGLFAGLPAFSIDLSAPTLPLLPAALGTSVTVAGLTLSLFMAGFAAGQFGAGTLSDAQGRRPVLLGGLVCYAISGFACTMATSGAVLAVSRFIQGFGAGACAVIAFAMIQDLFEGDTARAKRSYVSAVFSVAPIIAPAVGAALVEFFGWRSVHAVLACAGVILAFVTVWLVPESRPTPATGRGGGPHPASAAMRRDPVFVRATCANALSYGVIFVYIAGSPVVIIGQLGYGSSVFAAVFACTATALSVGAWANGRLANRGVGPDRLIRPAFVTTLGAALAVTLLGLTQAAPVIAVLPLLVVILFARGLLAPNLQHIAIERQRDRAGAASAVVGVTQLLAGAAASAVLAGVLPYAGPISVALIMLLLASGGAAVWRWRT